MKYLNEKEIEDFINSIKGNEGGFLITAIDVRDDEDDDSEIFVAITPFDIIKDSLNSDHMGEEPVLYFKYVKNITDIDLNEISAIFK